MGMPGHNLRLYPQHMVKVGCSTPPILSFDFASRHKAILFFLTTLFYFFLWRQDICSFISLYVLSLVPLLQTFTYLALAPSTRSKTYIYGISNFKI